MTLTPATFLVGYLGFVPWGQSGTTVLTGAFTSLRFKYFQSVNMLTSGAASWDKHKVAVRGWRILGNLLLSSDFSSPGGSAALAAVVTAAQGTVVCGQYGVTTGYPKLGGLISWVDVEIEMLMNKPMRLIFEGLGNDAPAWTIGDVW